MRSSFSVAINPYENVASIHEMLPEILESHKKVVSIYEMLSEFSVSH